MEFRQYKDGSCDLVFTDEELKIINKNKKVHLSDTFLRHFGNNLVKIVADWNSNFNKELQNLQTKANEDIVVKNNK